MSDNRIAQLRRALRYSRREAFLAKKRALHHEFEVIWSWCFRAAAGWRLHRRIEDFRTAIIRDQDKDPFLKLLLKLPSPETQNLLRAIVWRVTLGRLLMTCAVVAPPIIFAMQFYGLERQNALLSEQIKLSKETAARTRDIEYLRIIYDRGQSSSPLKSAAVIGVVSNDRERAGVRFINLEGASLDDVLFPMHSDLLAVDFSKSRMRNTSFINSEMSSAVFEDADLSGAKFDGATLLGARFKNANLEGATLSETCLASTDLSETTLFPSQLKGACGDAQTKLPASLPKNFTLPPCRLIPATPSKENYQYGHLLCRK